MNSLLCTVVVVLLSLSTSFGQSLKVEFGKPISQKEVERSVDLGTPIVKVASVNFSYSTSLFFDPVRKTAYSGFGYSGKSQFFEVYNNYLDYAGVKKLTAETIDEKATLYDFIPLNNKLYILYGLRHPKQDSFSLYVNEVSPDMVILGSPIALHSFKDLTKYGMNVAITLSEDKKHILAIRLLDTKSKEVQRLECKLLDNNFTEEWYKYIETAEKDKEIAIRSANVDDAGNMHLLVEYIVKGERKPIVYSYFWHSRQLKTFEPGLAKGENFGTRLTLTNGQDPYIVGLNEEGKTVRYFVSRINMQSQTVEHLSSQPMPPDFWKIANSSGFRTKLWSVKDLVTLDTESMAASVESVIQAPYEQVQSYNVYVFSFAKDGSHIWQHTVQKKQITRIGFAGHHLIAAKDKVLVIYNDAKDNLAKAPDVTKVHMFNEKGCLPVVQEIDGTGKASKYPLVDAQEFGDFMLYMKIMRKIEPGLYFSPAAKTAGRYSFDVRNVTFRVN